MWAGAQSLLSGEDSVCPGRTSRTMVKRGGMAGLGGWCGEEVPLKWCHSVFQDSTGHRTESEGAE